MVKWCLNHPIIISWLWFYFSLCVTCCRHLKCVSYFVMVCSRNNKWSSSNDVISVEKIRLYTFSDKVMQFCNQKSKLCHKIETLRCSALLIIEWECFCYLLPLKDGERERYGELVVMQTFQDNALLICCYGFICGFPVISQYIMSHIESETIVVTWSKTQHVLHLKNLWPLSRSIKIKINRKKLCEEMLDCEQTDVSCMMPSQCIVECFQCAPFIYVTCFIF